MIVVLCFPFLFFFSSRRRHTRCALVTGVQTCALPISSYPSMPMWKGAGAHPLQSESTSLLRVAEAGRRCESPAAFSLLSLWTKTTDPDLCRKPRNLHRFRNLRLIAPFQPIVQQIGRAHV